MDTITEPESERVVFVTEDGVPTGETGPKLASHHADTRLHLAFSCYVLRRSDQALLITQRALDKKVWPGVWTNSVCGHPAPDESLPDAVRRRARYEIGLPELDDLECVLPKYRYRTPPFNGIVENEFCPVFVAWVEEDPAPNPEEVGGWRWLSWPGYAQLLADDEADVSYWAKDQFEQLKDKKPFSALG
ncbi:isopentenyl-diphosphate Delta-isomerase [Amycolatopsis sp. FDAARGOS 1241]|uniref:isopentenyl-diphosphate Delta-isomerase n=1 Tax=Amycolatopsis sp. FDAARGOS 1241 TaxID=2778070 RepID=UPI001951C157|nr:isopentenyl-diphosphate Delta-isomerase [Amycolatopsis sp. FDAARGOS 1241]QRP46388.1 isopentenyl-diphosphate Delta-isomerase [Amycolatopsis sp. FDAARGOS 1241]